MRLCYEQNRFEIKQNMMMRKEQPCLASKNLLNCE
jgi:hypothetical protein